MENDKFFDFERNKVQTLTLEQLERTHKENDVHGKPMMGIYHYELIHRILEMCNEKGFDTEVYDLFAAQNKERYSSGVVLLPQVEAKYGPKAVEAHILRRVFANIRLKNFDDETFTTNLAVAFHQKGIQVGFGNMVVICHNQCMLCPDKYIATYSERGTGRGNGASINQILSVVPRWLAEAERQVMEERTKMQHMMEWRLNYEEMIQMIGDFTAMRVKVLSRNLWLHVNTMYPLSSSQINVVAEELLLRYEQKGYVTLWDAYNASTECYKADRMEIPSLLSQNRAMAEYLTGKYGL